MYNISITRQQDFIPDLTHQFNATPLLDPTSYIRTIEFALNKEHHNKHSYVIPYGLRKKQSTFCQEKKHSRKQTYKKQNGVKIQLVLQLNLPLIPQRKQAIKNYPRGLVSNLFVVVHFPWLHGNHKRQCI